MNTATKSAKSLETIAPGPVWINNVLLLTDFSPVSTAALHYALSVARRFRAKVYVTHVLEPPLVAPRAAAFYEATPAREDAEKKFGALLDEGELNDVLHETILSEEPLSRVVEEVVREKDIDLI